MIALAGASVLRLHGAFDAISKLRKLFALTLIFSPHLFKLGLKQKRLFGQIRLTDLGEVLLGEAQLSFELLLGLLLLGHVRILHLDLSLQSVGFFYDHLFLIFTFLHVGREILHLFVNLAALTALRLNLFLQLIDELVELVYLSVFVIELAGEHPVVFGLLLLSTFLKSIL